MHSEASFSEQGVDEIPHFIIPTIFSFLEVEDMCRCGCVAKAWASCLQLEPMATRV